MNWERTLGIDRDNDGQIDRESGAYGMNGFLYDPNDGLDQVSWVASASLDNYPSAWFGNIDEVQKTSLTPSFADCNWIDTFPHHNDLIPPDLTKGARWTEGLDLNPWQIGRMTLYRHNKKVNISFIDGHARTTSLGELWTYQWSDLFEPRDDVTLD